MQSNKTHEQHLRIIRKEVDTSNAGPDFDIKADLERSDALKAAEAGGAELRSDTRDLTEDRGMVVGEGETHRHRKASGAN